MTPPVLPELGPWLGPLVEPGRRFAAGELVLDDLRWALATAVFEGAGEARARLARGDADGARRALGADTWLAAWERAVVDTSGRTVEEIERRFRAAARLSRMPRPLLEELLPDEAARRALAARLGATGIPLEEALGRLEQTDGQWPEPIRRLAGELEVAWDALEHAVLAELARVEPVLAPVREWKRPWRPLALTAIALGLAVLWLGLVLGGYLRVPAWFRPAAEWIWGLGWL